MKKSSDKLFHIIKALSKSEKRYFKLFAARHAIAGKNNYLRLFEALDKQKVYDAQAITTKFAKKAFAQRLPLEKIYLYKMILKSMRAYSSEKTMEYRLIGMQYDIKFLFEKGFYQESMEVIQKAKKHAYHIERYAVLANILNWEKQIISIYLRSGLPNHKEIVRNEVKFSIEYEKLLKIMWNINDYYKFDIKIFSYTSKLGVARTAEEKEELLKILNSPMFHNEGSAYSGVAKEMLYNTQGLYCMYTKDYGKAIVLQKKRIAILESHPARIQHDVGNYRSALSNMLVSCAEHGKEELFEHYLLKLKTIPNKYPAYLTDRSKMDITITSLALELDMMIFSGKFKECINRQGECEEILKTYERKISVYHRMLLTYLMAYSFFGSGHYSEALKWINTVLERSYGEIKEDDHTHFRFLNIVIHYELGNIDLVEFLARSLYGFLYKKNRVYKMEGLILGFIRKKIPIADSDEMVKAFRDLLNEIEEIDKDPFERNSFKNFDIRSWFESKVRKKSFASIVSEKRMAKVKKLGT